MAVFLSFWSFLYTYRLAKWKFWLGFGLVLGVWIISVIDSIATQHGAPLAILSMVIDLGVWIWAIVDRATTPLDASS